MLKKKRNQKLYVLYSVYYEKIYQYAYGIFQDEKFASESAAFTILKLYKSRKYRKIKDNDVEGVARYIVKVMHKQCMKEFRKRKRKL